jgi:cyclic-di-GMP-binding protein
MASEFSFDVVSKVNMQFVSEGVTAALKEIVNRYDFKDTNSTIELNEKDGFLTLQSKDEYKMKALVDVLAMRLAKRGLPMKNFVPQSIETALGGTVRQKLTITQGIPSDKAKEIVAEIKKAGIKVQASIQGDQLRVTSKSKDLLQDTMTFLKGKNFEIDLQFTNYR